MASTHGVGIQPTRALLPDGVKEFLITNFIRAGGVIVLAVAGYLSLSLVSYSPQDPSWNSVTLTSPSNWGGAPGAWIADLALQSIGIAAAFVPVCLAAWGWRIMRRQPLPGWRWRLFALIAALPPLALLAATATEPDGWPLRAGLGGALGQGLIGSLYELASLLPAQVPISLAVLGMGLVTALPLAFFALGIRWTEWRDAGLALTGVGKRATLLMWYSALNTANALSARKEAASMASPRQTSPDVHTSPSPSPIATTATKRVSRQKAKPRKTKRASQADQAALDLGRVGDYQLPPLGLLAEPAQRAGNAAASDDALEQNARMLETVLQDFGIKGEIIKVRPGPVVTLYELEPAPGIKSARVIGLADDIARSMSAISARVAVIPGRNAIGIELPNPNRETVFLRELLSADSYENTAARLTLALGKNIGGEPVIADLTTMPHLLIAGTTGSGKSVAINTMILSLLYRLPPDQCKFIMIDPKMLELSVYDDIPHLLAPVVTDPGKAVVALKWAVREMEDRYRKMSRLGVRSITAYNQRVAQAQAKGEVLKRTVQTGFDANTGQPVFEEQEMDLGPLPLIVIIVDEMADLMMVAGKDIEGAVQRLAQMARAAGLHLIMATQRPSVDVITGTIKANFPTRISFQVTSKIDSRTILGEQGAEQLLGQGDMLYMAGGGRVTRVHGPFVSDEEVEKAVAFLKAQGAPDYLEEVTEEMEGEITPDMMGIAPSSGENALYDQAVAIVAEQGRASTSLIQRHLRIGYNRAARIMEEMEQQGVVSPPNHAGKREVLIGEH